MSQRLSRSLVLSLLRVAKQYDKSPCLKAALVNPFADRFILHDKLLSRKGYEDKVMKKEIYMLLCEITRSVYGHEHAEYYKPHCEFVKITTSILRNVQRQQQSGEVCTISHTRFANKLRALIAP
jgi:hypothetical protein